jgi:serine/threonine protein kinase
VHRDLKPDNVFLVGGVAGGSASDDVRVVDFGAAKIIGSSRVTRQGIVFGTPAYMSPEQASGQTVDHRVDIYSLGIIMYEMFAGRVPFEADTYMGVLTQHMFVQPVPPSQVSPAARELGALEEITLICLAKKPEERFASMTHLIAALDAVVRFRDDGSAEVAPRLESGLNRSHASVSMQMADELEPPTLAEMREAIDGGVPYKRIPWGYAIGAGAVLISAAVAWAIVRTPPAPPSPAPAGTFRAALPPRAPQANPTGSDTSSLFSSASVAAPAVAPRAPVRRSVPAAHPSTQTRTRAGELPPGNDDIGDPFTAKH